MNCTDVEPLFSDLADGLLAGSDRLPIEAHLAACAVCREGYAGLLRSLTALRGLPREEVPPGFAAEILERWSGAPAAPAASVPPPRPIAVSAEAHGSAHGAARRRTLGRLLAVAAGLTIVFLAFHFGREWESRGRSAAEGSILADRGARDRETLGRALEGLAAARGSLEAELAAARERSRLHDVESRVLREELVSLRQASDAAARQSASALRAAQEAAVEAAQSAARDSARGIAQEAARAAVRELADRDARGAPSAPLWRPSVAYAPALASPAVALDPRRLPGEPLSIDLRGPDSRVIPGLLALCESGDEEVSALAIRLLQRRLDVPPPSGTSATGEARGAEGGSGGVLVGLKRWAEGVGAGLGLLSGDEDPAGKRTADPEGSDPPPSARRREVDRLRELWRRREASAVRGSETERI